MSSQNNQNEKLVNGKIPTKPILQFTVTPPRQSGPSEAERKIEALTQQLEEEFEKEEESEYFGKSETIFLDFAPNQIDYFSILFDLINLTKNNWYQFHFTCCHQKLAQLLDSF